jgi:hypothetical protein
MDNCKLVYCKVHTVLQAQEEGTFTNENVNKSVQFQQLSFTHYNIYTTPVTFADLLSFVNLVCEMRLYALIL